MIFLLPLLSSLTIASSAPLSCASSIATNKTICTNDEINIDHFSNNTYKENDEISDKEKIDLDEMLIKLNQQLEIYKKDNKIDALDKENLIKFNDWLENKYQEKNNNLVPNNYSSGQNAFKGFWWGFKIWVTWDKLKEIVNRIKPSQPLTSTGLFSALKLLIPSIGVAVTAVAIITTIGALQVGGCLLGRQIWNKKGVVMRFLWVGVMTGCWDQ